jgi:uncharacterized protein
MPRLPGGKARFLLLGLALAQTTQGAPAIITLTLPSGKAVQAEVMVEDQDRAMGLMFRPSLPQDRVLLFVFEGLGFHGIWMKNCRFPIDIVWLDEERLVVHVAEAVPPCRKDPCPSYEPMRKAVFVVEMNAGLAAREGVEIGRQVSFELPR